MNANPADCDCERCEIDRERAPYQLAWLTAFREATTAQVSAALEANGALLALTGLMLDKESELSGTVVGRPAGRQGQGEQSPMAAAEMERRIGLMGRLNDAAARLRPQPEPEVADNDAELWYAACFACTTSLQKVVQSILDTYPMGFPAAAAQQQVDRVLGALLAMGPEAEALSDLLLPYPLVMSDLADAGLHDVAGDRFASSCRRCKSRTCATAPCWRCWRRWRGMNRTYRNTCCATRSSTPNSLP